jgi:tRNA G18 (ribose-2'-O)-methylase SpoU
VPLAEIELGDHATFVLGAERAGLPDAIAASCEVLASIPLADEAESLNVAAAGAIALYDLKRR